MFAEVKSRFCLYDQLESYYLLGLSKVGVSVTLTDNLAVRGMIRAVSHMVKVEKAE